jgi:hypothetical protein
MIAFTFRKRTLSSRKRWVGMKESGIREARWDPIAA